MLRIVGVALALAALLPGSASAGEPPAASWAALPTRDGVQATLYRYLPHDDPSPRRSVLLLPDVGMTHRAFDVGGWGLAPYLARHGVGVYVLEYRGTGRSEVPFGGFTFEDLLEGDAEAALERVRAEGGSVHVGGHGLGGTLAFLLAARHPDAVAGVVGLQAAAFLDVPNEPIAQQLQSLESAPPWLDLRLQLQAPLYHGRSWFEIMLANDDSLPPEWWKSLRLHVLAPVPRELVEQVAGFMRAGKITVGGRDSNELIRGWEGRSLLVLAPRDNWLHLEFAAPMRYLLVPRLTRLRMLNRIEGAGYAYGHLGMLLGTRADHDVWKPVLRFVTEEKP